MYTTNDLYLDVIESVDAIVDGVTGQAQICEVSGTFPTTPLLVPPTHRNLMHFRKDCR